MLAEAVVWSSNATELGGNLGEPLTVDCGTKSNPEADVEAYDQFERRLEESELKFVRANNEFTIPALTDAYQDSSVTCSAFITMTNKVTTVVSKTVRIRVWSGFLLIRCKTCGHVHREVSRCQVDISAMNVKYGAGRFLTSVPTRNRV